MLGEQSARSDQQMIAGLASTDEGICEGYDWPARLVKINLRGAVQWMPWVGSTPWKGDAVRVTYAGAGNPYCQAVYGSAMGTVQAVAASIATVTGDDGRTYRYPVAVGTAFTAGQRVRLDHVGQLVASRYAAEPLVSEYTVPGAPPGGSGGSATFRPIDSGNFSGGSFSSQFVEISDSRSGHYWYGTQIADTLTAVPTKVILTLSELWDQVPGTASRLGTHSQATRGAEPALSGAINVLNGGQVDMTAVAASFRSGAARGVGFARTYGWRRFDTFAASGSLYMEW